MAYIGQEEKAKLAPAIKAVFAKYKVKGSISIHNHSSLVVTVKSSPIDFIGNFNRVAGSRHPVERFTPRKDCLEVNQYWYHEHFDGAAEQFIAELITAMKGTRWYDRSDIQTDYFDTAYYINIYIGRWNKPYQLTA